MTGGHNNPDPSSLGSAFVQASSNHTGCTNCSFKEERRQLAHIIKFLDRVLATHTCTNPNCSVEASHRRLVASINSLCRTSEIICDIIKVLRRASERPLSDLNVKELQSKLQWMLAEMKSDNGAQAQLQLDDEAEVEMQLDNLAQTPMQLDNEAQAEMHLDNTAQAQMQSENLHLDDK